MSDKHVNLLKSNLKLNTKEKRRILKVIYGKSLWMVHCAAKRVWRRRRRRREVRETPTFSSLPSLTIPLCKSSQEIPRGGLDFLLLLPIMKVSLNPSTSKMLSI